MHQTVTTSANPNRPGCVHIDSIWGGCAGGEHSAGPIALLSGLNPQPNHLVKHFFSVALFGMARLPVRKGLYGIWLAFMLLATAVNIILPIINSEGIRCAVIVLACTAFSERVHHCLAVLVSMADPDDARQCSASDLSESGVQGCILPIHCTSTLPQTHSKYSLSGSRIC